MSNWTSITEQSASAHYTRTPGNFDPPMHLNVGGSDLGGGRFAVDTKDLVSLPNTHVP